MTETTLFLVVRMLRGHGVAVMAAEAARRLNAAGHRCVIGCLETDGTFEGLDIHVVPAEAAAITALAAQVGAGTVTAITSPYFEQLPALPPSLLRLAWEAGDPTASFFPPEEAAIRHGWTVHKQQLVYPHIDGVMTISEFLVADIGWPDSAVVTLGADHMPDLPRPARRLPGPLRIGALARLGAGEARYKGFAMLAPLRDALARRQAPVVIEVMGRGEPADAEQLRAEGFVVHLNATDEERATFLHGVDAFVTLSLWEGFDLPVVEAQAVGTPGLAFDTGSHPEVTPLLLPNIDAMADLLAAYAAEPALAVRHGEMCRAYVRGRFSWQRTAARYIAVRQGFASRRGHATPARAG